MLSKEVLKVQVAALREVKLKKAIHAVAEAGEEYAEVLLITRQKELPKTTEEDADEKPIQVFDLAQHGGWNDYGEFLGICASRHGHSRA